MSNLRWLILSSSASGAGLVSIGSLIISLSHKSTLVGFLFLFFVLTVFTINVILTAHYYSKISRQLYIKNKMQTQMKMRAKPTRYRY
ncbi:hypothetical protein Tery_4079 [Trichodesmium erythraeum IMS101]|uniref:Uncharacterized protein n=1 Tax=Trichodesmium erythraeum (strain IMS101) TaxID=203124 RepID=Q10XD6_TRIEI